jgi:MoaA/NifB/PqqE/SkfB family radical SAM enzyme
MYRRLDRLAELGTGIVTISGGEPLLHPELDLMIARIRRCGMIAGLITNGYLLTADRIRAAKPRRVSSTCRSRSTT